MALRMRLPASNAYFRPSFTFFYIMKKTIFALLLLSTGALSAQAQISAGTKLLSGSISYSRVSSKAEVALPNAQPIEEKQQQSNFSPTVGYFIADNLALGLRGGIATTKKSEQKYRDPVTGFGYFSPEIRTRTLSGGAFARYYKFVGEKVAFYGQVGGGYTNAYHPQISGYPENRRIEGLYADLLPGVVFFPTNKLGLELTLRGASYHRTTYDYVIGNTTVTQKNTTSNLDFGFGLNDLNLGISLYLGRD